MAEHCQDDEFVMQVGPTVGSWLRSLVVRLHAGLCLGSLLCVAACPSKAAAASLTRHTAVDVGLVKGAHQAAHAGGVARGDPGVRSGPWEAWSKPLCRAATPTNWQPCTPVCLRPAPPLPSIDRVSSCTASSLAPAHPLRQAVPYLVDLLADPSAAVRAAAAAGLDAVIDADTSQEGWAPRLRMLKFEAHNQVMVATAPCVAGSLGAQVV